MLNGKCKRLVAEVFHGEVNKPTTRNIRDATDFVHAKNLRKKETCTVELHLFMRLFVFFTFTVFKRKSCNLQY